jgi:hypothetical protein
VDGAGFPAAVVVDPDGDVAWLNAPHAWWPRVYGLSIAHRAIIEHAFDLRKVGGRFVSREVIYRCAGPDCATWIQSTAVPPPRGWIVVHEREDDIVAELDFCGWSCVLRFAARIDPEQVIEVEGL